jgi:hypothetical protein
VGYTLWLFNIAMEEGPSIDDDKNDDFSIAMLIDRRVN